MKRNTIWFLLYFTLLVCCKEQTSKKAIEKNEVVIEINNFNELADRQFIFPISLNDTLCYPSIITEGYYRNFNDVLNKKQCQEDSLNRFHITKHTRYSNCYHITTERKSLATPHIDKIKLFGYFFNKNIFILEYGRKTKIMCFLDKKLYVAVQLGYEKIKFTKENLEDVFILDSLLLPKHQVTYYQNKDKIDIEISSYIYSDRYFYGEMLDEKKYRRFVHIKNLNLNNIFLFSKSIEKAYLLLKNDTFNEEDMRDYGFNKHFRYIPFWSDETI
jgi:hypothetical protein